MNIVVFFYKIPYIILIINILYSLETTNKLTSIFSQIDDPRRDLTKLHQLNDILLIGITQKEIETLMRQSSYFPNASDATVMIRTEADC